jgi:hypothetical protein
VAASLMPSKPLSARPQTLREAADKANEYQAPNKLNPPNPQWITAESGSSP